MVNELYVKVTIAQRQEHSTTYHLLRDGAFLWCAGSLFPPAAAPARWEPWPEQQRCWGAERSVSWCSHGKTSRSAQTGAGAGAGPMRGRKRASSEPRPQHITPSDRSNEDQAKTWDPPATFHAATAPIYKGSSHPVKQWFTNKDSFRSS